MRPLDPRVRPLLAPARGALTALVTAGLIAGLLTVAQAFALGTLLVEVVREPAGTGWQRAALWLAGAILGRALASYAVDRCAAAAAQQVSVPLRRRVVESALNLDAVSLGGHRVGELTVLATRGVSAVEPYVTRYLPTLVTATVLPVATVGAIFWLDWLSGLIVILTLPLVPMFAVLIGLTTRDRALRQWRALATLSGHFLDGVRGLPTLVGYRRAEAQVDTIRAVTDRYRKATRETLAIAFASAAALELIATISVALVAVSVGLRLASGSVDFWTALVVLLLAPEAYWPLRRVGAEFHAAAEGAAVLGQIAELDSLAQGDRGVGGPNGPGGRRVAGGAIELEHLTLRYPNRLMATVSDLTASIPAQGLTAIAGPSGCGKSTLLNALVLELKPASGRIRVGGVDLAEVDVDSWRSSLAWGPQRPWLVAGTIRENLLIGRPDAGDADVWSALSQVSLAGVVSGLPGGLDAVLGEDGTGLSAGQRTRLALARIVLADRPYVFLDEPTAHLDAETEAILLRTLRDLARNRCVVVVAHSPAVLDLASQIVALPVVSWSRPASSWPPVVGPAQFERGVIDAAFGGLTPGRRWAGRRSLGTALGTLSVAAGVALTATASWLITTASTHPPVLELMVAIVGVRAFGLARPALRYAERLVSHDAALGLLAEQRARVYESLIPLVPRGSGARRGDVLASVVDDVDSLVDDQLRVRQPIVTAAWVGLGASALAALISPRAGMVLLAFCVIAGVGGWLAFYGVRRSEREFVERRAEVSTKTEEVLQSARNLVIWRADRSALVSLDRVGEALGDTNRRSAAALARGRLLISLASGAAVLVLAAWLPGAGVSGAMLALLVMVPVALADPLGGLPDAGVLAVRTRAARARLEALSSTRPLVSDPVGPRSLAVDHPRSVAHSVTAGWGDTSALVNFTLELPPGARVGLVGASGTGKSTYAAIMMRFLDPLAGRQVLGDIDLRALALDDVRRATGLVDDDPYVFASSIMENVRLARPEATDAEVLEALAAAALGDWIAALPFGAHTHVGDGNASVSGGERARLGIARALLADQPILVLDEPTAHLDAATARAVAAEVLSRAGVFKVRGRGRSEGSPYCPVDHPRHDRPGPPRPRRPPSPPRRDVT